MSLDKIETMSTVERNGAFREKKTQIASLKCNSINSASNASNFMPERPESMLKSNTLKMFKIQNEFLHTVHTTSTPTTNKRSETKSTAERNGAINKEINNINSSSNSINFMPEGPESMLNSNTLKMFKEQNESAHFVHTTSTPTTKNQPVISCSAPMRLTKVVPPGISLLRCRPPSPKILKQFMAPKQVVATNSPYKKLPNSVTHSIASILTTAPSGTNLATAVNHANRPSVYRKPVSTKGTAPTKNINEINTSGFATNFLIDPPNSIRSSTIGIAQNSSVTITKFGLPPIESALVPAVHSSSNESVNGASLDLTRENKTLDSEQSFDGFTTTWRNDKHQQALRTEYSEQEKVNNANQMHKRSRAKSAYISDTSFIDGKIPKMNIINVNDLPEKSGKSDTSMYNNVISETRKRNIAANQRNYNKVIVRYESKLGPKLFPIASGSNNVRISNGQLSDMNGPIRLLDAPTKQISTPSVIARIQSQNDVIASLPIKDKLSRLKESMESNESVLNLLQNVDGKQIKRTYSRSKSLHFKVHGLKSRPTKLKKLTQIKPNKHSIDHDKDWQIFSDSMSSNIAVKPIISSGGGGGSEQTNHGNGSRAQSLTEIEHVLSWNTSKTLGQLPRSQLIFQRNEFGMTEMDKLAMTKLKAMKQHKNKYKIFPQLEPSMACGHADSATCFDTIIQRLNSNTSNTICKVNEKKPHQYYSTEFKQVIGAIVQNKNNNCQAITTDDVKEALRETNMYDRTKNSSLFSWSRFIDYYNKKYSSENSIRLAPSDLFVNAIPRMPNTFEIGQKLEAIDPQNCDLFCVCTIVDKCGYRIKLRFDGSSSIYDFWVNADSKNIFPAGWCSKTGRELEVNRRLINNRTMSFQWEDYLRTTNTQAAHRACFPNANTARTQMNPFKIGMKLEADDIKNTGRICVATIGDVIDSRILIRLDELDSCYNYWTDIRSPVIHPVNFHQDDNYSIASPPSWRATPFSWEAYLRTNRAEPVPRDAFHTREPKAFAKGMALEVIDKRNPTLIRPAIVTMVQDYQVKVLFIGWPEKYAYWVDDDSCDIFPPTYCQKTDHPIECPLDDYIYGLPKNNCGILGCRGIGNAKRYELSTHSTLEECPYEWNNWSNVDSDVRPNRIDRKHKSFNSSFNIGAGPSRKPSVNPAFEKVQVSLQPTLNPAELAAMSSKDVEIFRRLQVSANFLLENRKVLSELRDQWIERMKPLQQVQIVAAAKNPMNWTKDEVAKFVSQLPNCFNLGSVFIENDIDGFAFLALRTRDMIDMMGLSTGAAIKVFNRIMLLREECNTHYIRYQ